MKKPTKSKSRKQPSRSNFSKELERTIAADEKQRLANEKSRIAREKSRQKRDAIREKDYFKRLKELEKTGIYKPKERKLTRYRKWRINKAMREWSEYLNPKEYFFVKPRKATRKVLQQADKLHLTTTTAGIFVPREGFTRARVRQSKTRRKEYEIVKEAQIKTGENKGKIRDEIIPLASLDELLIEENRFRRMAKSFGPLAKDERLAFIIRTNDSEGYSYNTYQDIELLIRDLKNRYLRSEAARIFLYRHISIVRTTLYEWRGKAKPFRSRKRKIKGRRK